MTNPSSAIAPNAHPFASVTAAALGLLTILFPFLILFAADHIGTWPILSLLACAAVLRTWLRPRDSGLGIMMTAQATAVALIIGVGLFNTELAARLYPVAVSGAMLAVFAGSLMSDTPVIERFARLTDPSLPPSGVSYCRTVTKVWCAFFIINGGVALATALWADRATWALYNGLISYVLIGCLFAGEYFVRQKIKRRDERGHAA